MANTLLWWLSGNRLGLSRTGRSAPLFRACLSLASRARDRQELVESLRMGVRLPTVFSPAQAARECFSGGDCGGVQQLAEGERNIWRLLCSKSNSPLLTNSFRQQKYVQPQSMSNGGGNLRNRLKTWENMWKQLKTWENMWRHGKQGKTWDHTWAGLHTNNV